MATAKITPAPLTRSLAEVAREVARDWNGKPAGMYFGAVPYVRAMAYLDTADLSDTFGDDAADDVVLRFLSNASTWRGPVAQRVKAELRAALAYHDVATHEPRDLPSAAMSDSIAQRRRTASARYRASRQGRGGAYDPLANPRGYR